MHKNNNTEVRWEEMRSHLRHSEIEGQSASRETTTRFVGKVPRSLDISTRPVERASMSKSDVTLSRPGSPASSSFFSICTPVAYARF